MNADDLKAWAEQTEAMVVKVMEADPTIHPITAHIIAGDLVSADRVTKQVMGGILTPEKGVWMVGSYARWGWTLTMVGTGHISEDWLAENIAHLWSACDPDDTDPANLAVWQAMTSRHGRIIRDGRPLPKASSTRGYVRVYRGGRPETVRRGFAWTTDPKVAKRFASGAGERVPVQGGVVISGKVRASVVLAYITGRQEAEVIVDPRLVQDVEVMKS
jgi:hypothetical protein